MNDITINDGTDKNVNEPHGAPRRRTTKRVAWLGAAGLCVTTAWLVPLSGTGHAAGNESQGMVCNYGDTTTPGHPSFALSAADGYTSEPDGNAIYGWGFTATGSFQLPGPVLCVNQGDIVDINLTNHLPIATSIQFPGQEGVTSGSAPVGPVVVGGEMTSLVPEATANGGTVGYSFTVTHAGTYTYQSGSDPQLQVQMGLFGAIVVRPNVAQITAADIMQIPVDGGTTNGALMNANQAGSAAGHAACAYESALTDDGNPATQGVCDPLAIYDSARENILMLSEIDPGLHGFMEQNAANPAMLTWNAYPGAYEAHYFLINGRSMPDTLAPNNAPWMPSQPYGAMASVEPWNPAVNPLDALLRYVGVGVTGYEFHPHSNHEHVIATDGALMKAANGNDNTEEKFNILVNPGSTVDATFRWTNEEGYSDSPTNRLPLAWPQGLNLTEGDFWSGSPYLGESGALNPASSPRPSAASTTTSLTALT